MELNQKLTKQKSFCYSTLVITCIFSPFLILILFQAQAFPFYTSTAASRVFFSKLKGVTVDTKHGHDQSNDAETFISKLRESVTFLPLKDLRFSETAMTGNTWFMSSLNDTYEENEAQYLYFPSQATKGRILCIKGHDTKDGTKNSYALAWKETLPASAILLQGLSFVSDTYYDYSNLWHGVCAMAPFVGWSMKNKCWKPTRWVLFHWGELRSKMGSWLNHLMQATFGEIPVESFEGGDVPHCFEKAVMVRHNAGMMGREKKLEVFDLLRCKARSICSINPVDKGKDVNERGEPIIRLTLLMRRGSRSFKNATAVTDIFARECKRVRGCLLKVVQSGDLSFCEQVKVMADTDIVASPHGAQLTNMFFMDRNSSVLEFFPKGWLELAGIGQYAHHWMADISGMKHRGAWWDQHGEKECPFPKRDSRRCFTFYKDGQVGHNETFFAEWARKVVNHVRIEKLEKVAKTSELNLSTCAC
ncbi:Glycosyltransferase AER61 [Quillaja saponaria]|uniref:Glycosyltransferase AER61 n=1 Tax=Quillaja saponaria TaxID=32244 RepID=A0AAD7PRQ1_QUISA|nr:Glycosyltransferase AER61 [Quillaja saponaria]